MTTSTRTHRRRQSLNVESLEGRQLLTVHVSQPLLPTPTPWFTPTPPPVAPHAAPAASSSSGIHITVIQESGPPPVVELSSTTIGDVTTNTFSDGSETIVAPVSILNPQTGQVQTTMQTTHVAPFSPGLILSAELAAYNTFNAGLASRGMALPQPGTLEYDLRENCMQIAGMVTLKSNPTAPNLLPSNVFIPVIVTPQPMKVPPKVHHGYGFDSFNALLGGREMQTFIADHTWARVLIDVIAFIPSLVCGAGEVYLAYSAADAAATAATLREISLQLQEEIIHA